MPQAPSSMRIAAAACAAWMITSFSGCGGSADAPATAQVANGVPNATPNAAPAANPAPAAQPAPASKPAAAAPVASSESSGESAPATSSPIQSGAGQSGAGRSSATNASIANSSEMSGSESEASSGSSEGVDTSGYTDASSEMNGRGSGSGAPAANAANNPLAGFVAGFATAAATPVAPSIPEDFRAQAELAYQHGLETQAHQLFLAHLVANPNEAKDDYEKLVVSPLQKRPVLSVRWGIGVNTVRDDGYGGDAHPPIENMPIPADGQINNGPRNNRGSSSGNAGSDSAAMTSSEGMMTSGGPAAAPVVAASGQEAIQFRKDFGMVAEILESEFEKRYSRGDFGSALASMQTEAPLPTNRNPNAQQPGMSPDSRPDSSMDATMTSSGSDSSAMATMDSREGAMAGMAPGVGPAKGPAGPPPKLVLPDPDAQRFRPGLIFVGGGKTDEMLAKAKELGIPVIFECLARVQKRTNNIVQNDIRIRVLDVSTGQALTTCKVNNVDIYRETRNPKNQKEENPKRSVSTAVRETMEPMFNAVDTKIKVRPMPSLQPEAVRSRVSTLLAASHKERLLALAELRLYQARGLLNDEDMAAALDLMLGDDGLVLLSGSPAKQKEIMARFVERLSP